MWTRLKEEGAHPFLLLLSKNGSASGLFIDSSYPMDVKLQRDYKINIMILHSEIKIRYLTIRICLLLTIFWYFTRHVQITYFNNAFRTQIDIVNFQNVYGTNCRASH